MMFHREEIRKARKSYPCEACMILGGYTLADLLDAHQEQDAEFVAKVQRAMETPRIEKGVYYVYCWGKNDDGEFYTFRANLEADQICLELDLYDGG